LRRRKELEEECKRLSTQVEQNNAVWISRLQTARNQQTRFEELISCSVRIAKQNNEKKAVKALTERLAELQTECCQFEKDRAKLKKECEIIL
uniref:CCD89 protein n=1 Tax=Haemonchus placei TaxID=6290 RepID=A0A0N4W6R4_HAEPC